MILKRYESKFLTYKISRGVYTFEDLSEVLSRGFKKEFEFIGRIRPNHKYDRSDSIVIESDNVTLINKLNVNPQIHALRFDKKPFFDTDLGFSPYWEYKSYHSEYYKEKKSNLSTIDKHHIKDDGIDSSVLNGVKQPIP